VRASIIIAGYNEGQALSRTIESCVETCADLDYEILVADDASTDGSVEAALRRFVQVRVHRHERRQGASPTKALGARNARGEVLIFLDGHSKPEYGAVLRLVQDVEEVEGLAIITPAVAALDVERWKNDFSQVGHGYTLNLESFDCGWQPLHVLRGVREGRREFYESAALIGCAMAVSRELYEKLWGFDAHMRSWGVEDLDFGLKSWLMGYRILHDAQATIGHRFRESFDNYSVPIEHVVANQLRMARKNFTHGVWAEWLERCRQRNQGPLAEHPEGLFACAWQLFNGERDSVEQERSYLHFRRPRDEFWYAERFSLSWPRLGSAVAGRPFALGPSPSPSPSPKPSPSPSPPPPKILVVNMIPQSLSNETNQDSEPNLAVNPASPQQIAGTAFTPDPGGGTNAPIYVSTDGGRTWQLNATVPGGNNSTGTGDITIRFGGTGNTLYTGDLRGDSSLTLNALRTANFASNTPMTILESRAQNDQPFVQAATVSSGAGSGNDRVYVGLNDFAAPGGMTATIDLSLDARAVTPTFTSARIEKRSTAPAGQDGPQIRPTIHSSGVIYAAFYGWRSTTGNFGANTLVVTTDVVVVRDDNWGQGANPFTALVDPGDGKAGLRVVTGIQIPFQQNGTAAGGFNRRGGDLSIAVDPTDSTRVFLAYADQSASGYGVHIRKSTDSGKTWGSDLLTLVNATVPALAISSVGEIGLMYQQLTGTGANQRWLTHFRFSLDGLLWSDVTLATVPATSPVKVFDPYLGDYIFLMAVGKDFYGVFCANNTPDTANFPQGVVYQRNANFTTHTLLGTDNMTPVAVSIDPYFVKATR
jgi:glycosyltransferase involved in cell wall biosynthesis